MENEMIRQQTKDSEGIHNTSGPSQFKLCVLTKYIIIMMKDLMHLVTGESYNRQVKSSEELLKSWWASHIIFSAIKIRPVMVFLIKATLICCQWHLVNCSAKCLVSGNLNTSCSKTRSIWLAKEFSPEAHGGKDTSPTGRPSLRKPKLIT